jgi:hypothetical protein
MRIEVRSGLGYLGMLSLDKYPLKHQRSWQASVAHLGLTNIVESSARYGAIVRSGIRLKASTRRRYMHFGTFAVSGTSEGRAW